MAEQMVGTLDAEVEEIMEQDQIVEVEPFDVETEMIKVYRSCENEAIQLDILLSIDTLRRRGKIDDPLLTITPEGDIKPVLVPSAGPPLTSPPHGYFCSKSDTVMGSVTSPEGAHCEFTSVDEFLDIPFIKVANDFLFLDDWKLYASLHGAAQVIGTVTPNSYLPPFVFIKKTG